MRIALTFNLQRTSREAEAEFDRADSIAALAHELASLGHDVVPIDVTGSVALVIARLERCAPELVFNLAEGERGAFREAFYPALFEQLGLAHTGSSASTLALCLDKTLAKRVVAAAGVRTPADGDVGPPWIVKPNFEGSSKGITQASVVTAREDLPRALAACRYDAIAEQYIDGIDVAAAWIDGLGVVTPIAYAYEPTGAHAIYDYALKRAPARVRPYALDSPAVVDAAERAFAALGVDGYGRADFRLARDGTPYFLEMNPLPDLHDEDLYLASGLSRRELLAIVVKPRRSTSQARSPARRAAGGSRARHRRSRAAR